MSNVLSLARKLAKLEPDERRLAASIGNELAGDGRKRRRRNGRRKAAAPARVSKPRPKPAPVRAVAPKAAAPRIKPRMPTFEEEE